MQQVVSTTLEKQQSQIIKNIATCYIQLIYLFVIINMGFEKRKGYKLSCSRVKRKRTDGLRSSERFGTAEYQTLQNVLFNY